MENLEVVINHDEARDKLIRKIQQIGESLIRNAESIVGTEEYITAITINCYPCVVGDEPPEIRISKSFVPENYVSGH